MKIITPEPFARGAFSKIFLEFDIGKNGLSTDFETNLQMFEDNKIKVRKIFSPYIPSMASSYLLNKKLLYQAKLQFKNEIKILKSLNHPNIIKLKE